MKSVLILASKENTLFSIKLKNILNMLKVKINIVLDEDTILQSHYDYIILNSSLNIGKVVLNGNYCIINMDLKHENSIDIYGNIVTYGFGSKNTVTFSSIEKESGEFVYCLQRYLEINPNEMLEPQEIPIQINLYEDNEIYACMVAVTIALMENFSNEDIKNAINFKYITKNV